MEGSTKHRLPMETVKIHARTADEAAYHKDHYRQAIESLMFAALGCRPDIAYAVGVPGRFAAIPSILPWLAIKNLSRYLVGTIDYRLAIVPPSATCGAADI
jgi:hypothetical protein